MLKKKYTLRDNQGREFDCFLWHGEAEPKCIIQLSHGMEEHPMRYDVYAKHLCSKGFAFCAGDHPGHGASLALNELGYFGESGYEGCIDRLLCVTQDIKRKYPNTPIILLGHSMGSFMARAYAARYANEINGLIIMGTSGPNPMLGIGRVIIKLLSLIKGGRSKSPFVSKLMFGAYNNRFDGNSPYEWLTKDREIVEAYEKDEYCGFGFTLNGYKALTGVLSEVSEKSWATKIPKDLPIFIVSGKDDPVGNYGKGVRTVYERLKQAGVKNVSLRLFENDRHEILNETDKEEIYHVLDGFINEVIGQL